MRAKKEGPFVMPLAFLRVNFAAAERPFVVPLALLRVNFAVAKFNSGAGIGEVPGEGRPAALEGQRPRSMCVCGLFAIRPDRR